MALTIIRPTAPEPKPSKGGSFNYSDWYEKNKKRLSEKKKRRYETDPEYREAARKRSRAQVKAKAPVPITDGFTESFSEVAKQLGVSTWTLREWGRRGYYPEPKKRDGRLWFTPEQVTLLDSLRTFLAVAPGRVSRERKPQFEGLVSVIYANWQ